MAFRAPTGDCQKSPPCKAQGSPSRTTHARKGPQKGRIGEHTVKQPAPAWQEEVGKITSLLLKTLPASHCTGHSPNSPPSTAPTQVARPRTSAQLHDHQNSTSPKETLPATHLKTAPGGPTHALPFWRWCRPSRTSSCNRDTAAVCPPTGPPIPQGRTLTFANTQARISTESITRSALGMTSFLNGRKDPAN